MARAANPKSIVFVCMTGTVFILIRRMSANILTQNQEAEASGTTSVRTASSPSGARANVLRGLFRGLGGYLFPLPNTLPRFVNCNGSRFLVFHVRVRSGRHKSSCLKIVQRLRPNPNQLASSNGEADSQERSHGESCDSNSNDSFNFHDLFSEACFAYIRLESRRHRKP